MDLPQLHELWNKASLIVSLCQVTGYPYLYGPTVDFIFDAAELSLDKALEERMDMGERTELDVKVAMLVMRTARGLINGCAISSSIVAHATVSHLDKSDQADPQGGSRRGAETTRWLANLLAPTASAACTPLANGPLARCPMCDEQELLLPETDSAPIRSQPLSIRLSVSTHTSRRSRSLDILHSVGRTALYPCPSELFIYDFHRSFLPVFCYYAEIMHLKHKADRGKTTSVRRVTGPGLV
jgi:hypothetical protein